MNQDTESKTIEVCADIVTTFSVSRSFEFPAIFNVTGVIAVLDEEGDSTPIGKTSGLWAPYIDLYEDEGREDLLFQMDAFSQEAHDLASLLYRMCKGDFRVEVPPSWLCVEWVEIDQEWRGNHYSYAVMQEWLECFGVQAFVACRADQGAAAKVKLEKHWTAFGFTQWEELLYHNSVYKFPAGTYMTGRS